MPPERPDRPQCWASLELTASMNQALDPDRHIEVFLSALDCSTITDESKAMCVQVRRTPRMIGPQCSSAGGSYTAAPPWRLLACKRCTANLATNARQRLGMMVGCRHRRSRCPAVG